tara:strand:- start:1465 stop:2292 length:828 start_codon:yes stop_codon:yes gene_type:complete
MGSSPKLKGKGKFKSMKGKLNKQSKLINKKHSKTIKNKQSKINSMLEKYQPKINKVMNKVSIKTKKNSNGRIQVNVTPVSNKNPEVNSSNQQVVAQIDDEFSEDINLFLETQKCDLFNKLNMQRKSRKQLKNTYLKNKDGLKDYYNKYLDCIDKNLETAENRLMMLRDPKFNDGLSPNQKKLNEMKLRRTIRKNKKLLRKICTRTEPIFCEKTEIPNEKLKRGSSVCQKRRMCKGLNVSLGNIPRDSKMFIKDITKTFLGPLIKTVSKSKKNGIN